MVAAFFQWNGRIWITVSEQKHFLGGFFKKDVLEQRECFRKHLWTYYSLLSWTNSSKARGLRFTGGTGGHILQCKLANFHSRNPKTRLRQGNDHPMIQLAMEFTGKASKCLATSWPLSSSHSKKNTSFWSAISKLICHTMCSRWCKSNWSTFSSFKLWIQILSVEKLRRKCKGDECWALKTLKLGCLMPWNTHNYNPRRLPQGKCARDPSRPMLTSVGWFFVLIERKYISLLQYKPGTPGKF